MQNQDLETLIRSGGSSLCVVHVGFNEWEEYGHKVLSQKISDEDLVILPEAYASICESELAHCIRIGSSSEKFLGEIGSKESSYKHIYWVGNFFGEAQEAWGLLGSVLKSLAEKSQRTLAFVGMDCDDYGETRIEGRVYGGEIEPEKLYVFWREVEAEIFGKDERLDDHVGWAVLKGLKTKLTQEVIYDAFRKQGLTGGMLLAISLSLAQWMKKNIGAKRVGIVLPPGAACTIVNLACEFCDKTPVNFNFTAGKAANESCIERSGVDKIFTAEAFVAKAKDFPWIKDKVDIAEVLKSIGKPKFLFYRLLVGLLPDVLLANLFSIPKKGGREEAGILFTSGSSGMPKGVVLTHRNVMSNVTQFSALLPTDQLPCILGSLPIFHSFGFTTKMWWPLICGPRLVTWVSPLDVQKLIGLIEKHQIALMCTTPTFLKNFARKANPEQLKSLKMVITGAEKLPPATREEFEKKFGIPVCEGYGITETSPVISTNVNHSSTTYLDQKGEISLKRDGSVGRPLKGLEVKVVNPETHAPMSVYQQGLLLYRGGNVFEGYLDDEEKTKAAFIDGWYQSGDIGRVDKDGFLYIEGRLSRFSKIGGEMVPHGSIENRLHEIFEERIEGRAFVVMGVKDPTKGESLVLLTTVELSLDELRSKMGEAGMPNLWVPKKILPIDEIPMLASGKLDLKGCQKVAEETA